MVKSTPLRVALSVPVWKRPRLTYQTLTHNLSLDIEDVEVVGGVAAHSRRPDAQVVRQAGWQGVSVENSPLTAKHEAALRAASEFDVHGVIHLNSDDFLSEGYLRVLFANRDAAAFCLRHQEYARGESRQGFHLRDATPGSGTYISMRIIDRADALWPGDQDRYLDRLLHRTIQTTLREGETMLRHDNTLGTPARLLGVKMRDTEQMWALSDLISRAGRVSTFNLKPYLRTHYNTLLHNDRTSSDPNSGMPPWTRQP